MTRLSEANTSREIELSRYFRKWTDKSDLLVLVEGNEDIPFWSSLLQEVKERYAHITVETLKVPDAATGTEKDRRGKDALMEIGNLGSSKVIAVDMDYDAIVPSYHSYSSRILTDKYILHTIYYSIENHKLYPDCIKRYVEDVLKETSVYNFEDLLNEFSVKIYPLILLLIVYERKRTFSDCYEEIENEICIEHIFHEVCSLQFHYECAKEELQTWWEKVQVKYNTLFERYQSEILGLKKELQDLQITEDNCWKMLQGHTLANYLLRVLNNIIRTHIRERENKIRNNQRIVDKKTAIDDYHQSLAFITQNLTDEINYYFVEKPHFSDNDRGIVEIRKQIQNI